MHHDRPTRCSEIADWFRTHEDGEFCIVPPEQPLMSDGIWCEALTLLYAMKPFCLSRIRGLSELPQPISAMGGPGLPAYHELPHVPRSVQKHIFVGDADPPDLMVYAWLREHLAIEWYGVSDDFLIRHGTRISERITIPLSDAERAAVTQLHRFCPDYRMLLGPSCAALIESGFKIEVEGAITGDGPAH